MMPILNPRRTYRLEPLLLWLFLVVNCLFLTAAISIIYVYMSRVIVSEESKSRTYILNQLNDQLSMRMQEVEDTALTVSSHPALLRALSYGYNKSFDYYQSRDEIIQVIKHYVFSRAGFNSIYVYTHKFDTVLDDREPIFPMSMMPLEEIPGRDDDSRWTNGHLDTYGYSNAKVVLSLVRRLVNYNGDLAGYLKINIQQSYLTSFFEESGLDNRGEIFILNDNGQIVLDITNKQDGNSRILQKMSLTKPDNPMGGYESLQINGKNYLIVYSPPNHTRWRLVEIIPYTELYRNLYLVRNILLLVGAFNTLLFYIFARFFSKRITGMIASLLNGFRQVENGNFDIKMQRHFVAEIQMLYEGYDTMAKRLKMLLQRVEQEHREKLGAEIHSLLSQINPHFLYNTLDMINWMAITKGVPEVSEMIGKLARYFRIGLNKGDLFILLGEELEHGRLYNDIQKIKYKDRVLFTEHVHPDHKGLYVPKFILQPFIENALIHGLNNDDPRQNMRIMVSSEIVDNKLKLTIENDGNPLRSACSVEEPHFRPKLPNSGGYGMKNVQERIRLHFGQSFGVTIKGLGTHGVKVEILLPVLTAPQSTRTR